MFSPHYLLYPLSVVIVITVKELFAYSSPFISLLTFLRPTLHPCLLVHPPIPPSTHNSTLVPYPPSSLPTLSSFAFITRKANPHHLFTSRPPRLYLDTAVTRNKGVTKNAVLKWKGRAATRMMSTREEEATRVSPGLLDESSENGELWTFQDNHVGELPMRRNVFKCRTFSNIRCQLDTEPQSVI